MPKLKQNLNVLETPASDVNAKSDAVVSSVVITYVFTKYRVALKPEGEKILLKCLRLPPNKEVCSKFVTNVDAFAEKIR